MDISLQSFLVMELPGEESSLNNQSKVNKKLTEEEIIDLNFLYAFLKAKILHCMQQWLLIKQYFTQAKCSLLWENHSKA